MAIPIPLPDPSEFCVQLAVAPGEVCVEFPGGARVCATVGFETGDLSGIITNLLGSVNAGLAPLQPLLNIFDVLKAVFDCIQAIPDTLGPPPDPTAILNCIPGLAKAIDKILMMYPPLPIVVMVKGVLNAILLGLQGMQQRLRALIAQAERIANTALRAAQLGGGIGVKLQEIADCASSNLEAQLQNTQASVAPLNRLIGLINTLLELVGLPCVPIIGAPGEVGDAVLAPLSAAIEVLQQIIALIPGGVSLPVLPPAGEC